MVSRRQLRKYLEVDPVISDSEFELLRINNPPPPIVESYPNKLVPEKHPDVIVTEEYLKSKGHVEMEFTSPVRIYQGPSK